MALIQRVVLNNKTVSLIRSFGRCLSTESSIKKSVFISQSKDIYANLALQDWICKNMDMTDHHIMMLWQNEPCVTIGKSQNPWCEANVAGLPMITDSGVKMARQNTEGSSIYHDKGNLNITFFTKKDRLSETYDLEIIARAVFREFSLKLDIVQNAFKMRENYTISETSKKVDEVNAYHHCSLFVNLNKEDRMRCLAKQEIGIVQESNDSTKTKIMNLCEENRNVSVGGLVKAIGWEFMRTHASFVTDGGKELANKQKGFQLINPTNNWFPGINQIQTDLTRWEWLYGQTPEFKIHRNLCVPSDGGSVNLKITVSGGMIKDATLSMPQSMANGGIGGLISTVKATLIGRKFSPQLIDNLQESLKHLGEEKIANTYAPRQIMTSF